MEKPFLKWAGGKTRLCDKIREILPKGSRLIEPFVGSGAVFINTEYPDYKLSDNNVDLINLYQYLQKEGEEFIKFGSQFFIQDNNDKDTFYKLREEFNSTRDSRLKSALFIYLNRHCFNGLCRYNSKGIFNVPFGQYIKPTYPEKEMRNFYNNSKKAVFKIADFRQAMEEAEVGDVVYCDPPYIPLTETAKFTDYSASGFCMEDQKDLVNLAIKLQKKGIPVLISNHSTEWTRKNYSGATISQFDVQRFISADIKNRKKARELLAFFG